MAPAAAAPADTGSASRAGEPPAPLPPALDRPESSLSCPFPRQASASPCKPCPASRLQELPPALVPSHGPGSCHWHRPARSGMELGVNTASLSLLPQSLIPSCCCCQAPGLHFAKLQRGLLGGAEPRGHPALALWAALPVPIHRSPRGAPSPVASMGSQVSYGASLESRCERAWVLPVCCEHT